jgi:hypothetical protein
MPISKWVAASSAVVLALARSALAGDVAKLDGSMLAAAEVRARAAMSSVAEGVPSVETSQTFTVPLAGTRVQVLPVRYTPRERGELANVDHCAVVVLWPDRSQVVRTIGTGYLESLGCTGLDAIAFVDLDGDGQLEIALIQATLAPPDRYLKTPVVVRRGADGALAVDEPLTRALDEQGGITTIAALRRAAVRRLAPARADPAKSPAVRTK